jgi:hypothetical protein
MTTPQHDREPAPGDEGADAAAGGRTGAGRSSPAPKEPPAVRQPVSFQEVDRAEAVEIATTVINAAAVVVGGGVDSYIFTRLTEHVIGEIASGGAASGVRVKAACDATRTGHSHLPERYTDGWELTSALAVRLIPGGGFGSSRSTAIRPRSRAITTGSGRTTGRGRRSGCTSSATRSARRTLTRRATRSRC